MLESLCALALATLVGVGAQMEYDHGKIVSCYYSSWAYYRYVLRTAPDGTFETFLEARQVCDDREVVTSMWCPDDMVRHVV